MIMIAGLKMAQGLTVALDVVLANKECATGAPWAEALAGLRKHSRTFVAKGCDSLCISPNRPGPIEYEVLGEDTGFEDIWQVVHNWKTHEKCQEAGKKVALKRAIELQKTNTTTRQALFAAMGCLRNRDTWSKVFDANLAPKIGIFSECTVGRLYRHGVDVSIPTTPYPRLLEYRCNQSRLFSGAAGKPFSDTKPQLLRKKTDYDYYFAGSPTSSVRERLISKSGVILQIPRSKFIIIQSTTRHIKKMPEQKWTCKEESTKCACLEEAAESHHLDLRRSSFGLVPRGHGVYSFRLTEVMLAGAVPVILSNGWVLPFSEFLDWDSFSVRLDEAQFISDPVAALNSLIHEVTF